MPFYEYECSNCKYYAEVLQKISDSPLRKCPSCGRNTLKKLISAPVFRLKGSGWYETDFKSDKDNKRNLVGERDEAKSDSKEAKGEGQGKEVAQTAEGSKAAEGAKAAEGSKVAEGSKSAESAKSAEGAKAADTAKPATTSGRGAGGATPAGSSSRRNVSTKKTAKKKARR